MLIQLEVASLGMLLNTNAGEDSFKKSVLGVGRKVDLKRLDQCLKQKWDCSHIEEESGEGDGMDWYEDDEMVRHWGRDQRRGGEDCEGEDGR